MISRNPSFNELDCHNQVILKTVCPFCGKEQSLVLNGDRAIAYKQGKIAYEAGMKMQDAFPSFTADEREFIMTGICPTCWDSM